MKRIKCRCGRYMNPGSGHEWCSHCRMSGKFKEPESAGYTPDEELAVLRRARSAEVLGIIPLWRPQDTPGGIRYLVSGALLTLEDFDLFVARNVREWKARNKVA